MPHLLTLRGRHALSPFRVAKLEAALAAARPGHPVTGVAATFWHFVEVERELHASRAGDARTPADLRPARCKLLPTMATLLLVVPRPGTISPWSSKATDIARNCGLDAVARIERGIGFRVATRDGVRSPLRTAPRCCRCCTTG